MHCSDLPKLKKIIAFELKIKLFIVQYVKILLPGKLFEPKL